MASSETEIANMALGHLGVDQFIDDLELENTKYARACRKFFLAASRKAQRDGYWGFNRKIQALGLVEEQPNDEWAYSYQYPSDCLNFGRILSGARQDTRDSREPYRFAVSDQNTRLIWTDKEDAVGEWAVFIQTIEIFPDDYAIALSYLLAHYIAPSVTSGDPFKLKKDVMDLYMYEISKSKAAAKNEEQPDVEPDSEFIRARE